MRELDAPTYSEQTRVHCRVGGSHVDTERLGGTVEQQRVAERLCGRGEDEQLRLGGEYAEAPYVALFDLADHRLAVGQPEPAGEICGPPAARQLKQRKRITVALANDLGTHRRIEWAVHVLQQQRARIAVAEPVDRPLRQPGESLVTHRGAWCAYKRDPLSEKPAGDEPEDLRRGAVEPRGVVDDADQRLLLGDLGEQRQRRESHQEPVRRGTGAPAEHRRQGLPLGDRQPVEVIQYWPAELVEAAIGQLHLRLDSDGRRDVPTGDLLRQITQ